MSRKNNNTSDRPASTKTARDWCFTLSLTKEDAHWTPQTVSDDCVKYMVCQLEQAPSTGTLHYQGYIKFKNAVRMGGCKRILGSNQVNVSIRNGTQDEARNYCMKEETRIAGPFEFGNWDGCKEQGKRNDLDAIYKLAKEGKSRKEIMEAFPSQYMRYHTGIDKVISTYQTATDRPGVEARIYWGDSRSGKSTCCFNEAREAAARDGKRIYIWRNRSPTPEDYAGEEYCIIEELDGEWMPASMLKVMLDKWEAYFRVRFVTVPWRVTKFWITSNVDPQKWYKDPIDWTAISERCKLIRQFIGMHPEARKKKESNVREVVDWNKLAEVSQELLDNGRVPLPGTKWGRMPTYRCRVPLPDM